MAFDPYSQPVINGGRDADFRKTAETKPKRQSYRAQDIRNRHKRSSPETRRRNVGPDPGRWRIDLLFLLRGQRRDPPIRGTFAPDQCACVA
jgi:hypothetical protein